MKMKLQLLGLILGLFFFLGSSVMVKSQTFISPAIGLSTSKLQGYLPETLTIGIQGVSNDSKFKEGKLLFGLNIEHHLTEKFLLKWSLNYTNREAGFFDSGFVGYTKFKFHKVGTGFISNFQIFKNWYVGTGIGFNRLGKFSLGTGRFWSDHDFKFHQNQWAGLGSMIYVFKGLVFELRYIYSKSLDTKNNNEIDFINRMHAFELTIGYRIKVSK